ncbi:hypothetical protein, partial [Bacillus altitudinis]|uniref:hypothetical protein n=1 Tax=Bacillus altitudinis TaxID=293387 RepID=UPI003B52AE4E
MLKEDGHLDTGFWGEGRVDAFDCYIEKGMEEGGRVVGGGSGVIGDGSSKKGERSLNRAEIVE